MLINFTVTHENITTTSLILQKTSKTVKTGKTSPRRLADLSPPPGGS